MNNIIGVVGGDLRLVYLSEMFAQEEKIVYTYLLDKYEFNSNKIIKCNSLTEFKNIDNVITSIPISKDKTNINAPFSNSSLTIENLFVNIKGKIYTGALPKELKEQAETKYSLEIIDILENEKLSILNSIPTAEGAIQIAMEKSNKTLHDSNVLILGFGRIGKILSKMLNGIGANVYCEARKEKDLAMIKSYGYNEINLINLRKNINKFDFIFNTIPHIILDKEELEQIKKDCIIIDLASKPGGVNFEYANKIGLKASLELGLPGRVAPRTSAKYIKEIINL